MNVSYFVDFTLNQTGSSYAIQKQKLEKLSVQFDKLLVPLAEFSQGTCCKSVFPHREEIDVLTDSQNFGMLRYTITFREVEAELFLYFGTILQGYANLINTLPEHNVVFHFETA